MRHVSAVLVLLAVLAPAAAHAQNYPGARPMALGEAYRAVASGNEALFYNPAGLSLFLQRYNVDLGWNFNPEGGQHTFNGSIIDSVTNPPLGAGFAFSYFLGKNVVPKPMVDRQGYRLDLGLSYPLAKVIIGGFDVKYVHADVDKRGGAIDAANADVGLLWIISKWVRAGVTGHNLFNSGRPELPTQSAVGVVLGRENAFQASTDVVVNYLTLRGNTDVEIQYAAGLELMAGEMLALRLGYMLDRVIDAQYISTGLGIVAPRVGLDFAFKQNLETGPDRFFCVVLKFFAG